jgi:hypothetical protein
MSPLVCQSELLTKQDRYERHYNTVSEYRNEYEKEQNSRDTRKSHAVVADIDFDCNKAHFVYLSQMDSRTSMKSRCRSSQKISHSPLLLKCFKQHPR